MAGMTLLVVRCPACGNPLTPDDNDLVIACGKGHEQSICFGAVETPWSEHQVMRDALRRRLERH